MGPFGIDLVRAQHFVLNTSVCCNTCIASNSVVRANVDAAYTMHGRLSGILFNLFKANNTVRWSGGGGQYKGTTSRHASNASLPM